MRPESKPHDRNFETQANIGGIAVFRILSGHFSDEDRRIREYGLGGKATVGGRVRYDSQSKEPWMVRVA